MDKLEPQVCRKYAESNFSLGRILEMYQEWFDSLYNLYESTIKKDKGWSRITDRKDLNWLQKYV